MAILDQIQGSSRGDVALELFVTLRRHRPNPFREFPNQNQKHMNYHVIGVLEAIKKER